ncbi:MAG: hypothetical protein ACOH2T_19205 [Pseudomonas sp.]
MSILSNAGLTVSATLNSVTGLVNQVNKTVAILDCSTDVALAHAQDWRTESLAKLSAAAEVRELEVEDLTVTALAERMETRASWFLASPKRTEYYESAKALLAEHRKSKGKS